MKNYDELDPEVYDKRYELIPREGYLYNHWRPQIEEIIKRYCIDQNNGLDLGCGTGSTFIPLLKNELDKVIGLDVSIEFLIYGKKKNKNFYLIHGDAHNLPLKSESIDIVISNLFEFVNKELVIKEIHRILSNNGIFILLTLNQNSIYGIADDIIKKIKNVKSDKKRSSRTELIRLFNDHGFELLEFKINDGLIWLPGFIDKLLGKKIYMLVEKLFKPFSRNPFSNVMLVVIRKR